jgi:hypothetical protein
MIEAWQVDYQNPPEADHNWVETYLIPIVIPEEHIYALVYVCARPGIGVMSNQVFICGALSDNKSDLLHYNDNQHLPAPEKFTDWTSPIGLSIRYLDAPKHFRVDYDGFDDTQIHVEWQGLMDPFDIHDPNHSPQAGSVEDMHADIDTGAKSAYGHFDMTGRMTGTLKVRGREFAVDAVERMDHSWGPRDPMVIKNMYIVSATFGEDLAFHMICPWNPDKPGTEAFQLTHGYVLENGEVYGLTSDVTMTSTHHGLMCTGLQMTVKDVRGKEFVLEATADVGAPWSPYPSAITYNSMMRWSLGGRPGYGVVLPNYNLTYLNRARGRFYTDPSPAVWV